jgi:HEAT repeat protein
VIRVFNNTLDNMESATPEGVRTTTWTGWKPEDESQIKCLGEVTVPYIVELSRSPRSFAQLLAVKMLGWAGGKGIISPLEKVLAETKSHAIKMSALEALVSAPESDVRPILQKVAKHDPDSGVRAKANALLRK